MKCAMKTGLVALSLAALLPSASATRASLVADTCEYNTYMCCWTENDNGMEDNADVCVVNGEFQEGDEEVHCHGLVWADGASFESFILPLYKFVRTFDHRDARGYYGNIENAYQCECVEKMPIVSRADCTTYSEQGLVACENNDLRTHYENEMGSPGGDMPNLVKRCNRARGEEFEGLGGDGAPNGDEDQDDTPTGEGEEGEGEEGEEEEGGGEEEGDEAGEGEGD